MAYNFPESKWYKKSYNLIYKLDDISDNKNWYEKLNPIKLFKQDNEYNYDNTSIKYIE